MCTIPGLSVSEIPEQLDDGKKISLISFTLDAYEVPDVDRYGCCRLLSEFQKISGGTSGNLYKVKDTRYEKIVDLKRLKMPDQNDSISVPVMRELSILKSFRHENIVNMYGQAVGRSFESTYLILDHCEFDLSKVLENVNASCNIQEPHIKYIMYQLFTGLLYIHKNRVIHRDLCCSNILFTPDGLLKIADFGTACYENKANMTPTVMCRWYRAPELLFGSTHYTSAVDMWAAGCIFGELFLKNPLFHGETDMHVIDKIVQLLGAPSQVTWPDYSKLPLFHLYQLAYQPFNNLWKYFPYKSQTMLHLLNHLLVYNPSIRASASKCLQHAYFSEKPSACSSEEMLSILKASTEI